MQKINFQDLPSTSTPLNASTLNQMQDNIESAIEDVESVIPTIENSLDSDSTTNGASVHATKLLNTYSTNELKIGKWIDGRPIYRKVISTGTIDMYSASEKNINHNISNINEVISVKYSVYYSGDDSCYTDWDKLINTKVNATKVIFYIDTLPSSYTRFSKMYIVLEYTKSTDPVG